MTHKFKRHYKQQGHKNSSDKMSWKLRGRKIPSSSWGGVSKEYKEGIIKATAFEILSRPSKTCKIQREKKVLKVQGERVQSQRNQSTGHAHGKQKNWKCRVNETRS